MNSVSFFVSKENFFEGGGGGGVEIMKNIC